MGTGTPVRSAQETSDGAQQKAQEARRQGQDKVQEAASQAKSKLQAQIDQRSSQAAEQINQQASDLRAVSNSLRQEGKEGPAKVADKVAEYVTKAGSYLQQNDSDALLSDAEDLGRRQPWAVGAGALALGFAASRFLKASSRRRYSATYGQPSTRESVSTGTPVTPAPSETVLAGLEPSSPLRGTSAADLGTPGVPPSARTPAA